MPPFAALVTAAAATLIFIAAGSYVLYRVVDGRIMDLRNELEFMRKQWIDERARNEALQNRVVDLGGEVHFQDGALNETRLARRDDP